MSRAQAGHCPAGFAAREEPALRRAAGRRGATGFFGAGRDGAPGTRKWQYGQCSGPAAKLLRQRPHVMVDTANRLWHEPVCQDVRPARLPMLSTVVDRVLGRRNGSRTSDRPRGHRAGFPGRCSDQLVSRSSRRPLSVSGRGAAPDAEWGSDSETEGVVPKASWSPARTGFRLGSLSATHWAAAVQRPKPTRCRRHRRPKSSQ
jgi:hypothetical protein